jgi:hypothetical protein
MNLRTKLTSVVTLSLLAAAAIPASAFPLGKKKSDNQQEIRKLTPAQNALIDKAIAREKVVVQTLKKRTPLVETYIQNMKPDPIMSQAPESDQHFLARVDFGKVINDSAYAGEKRGEGGGGKFGFFKGSLDYITHLSASLHLTYHDSGFVQMLLVDSNSFNRQMYQFSYVRGGFLGSVPVAMFDVQPMKKGAVGRFAGRIYIDQNSGSIVRFTGSFSGGTTDVSEYFHFDSWRTSSPDGLWLPYEVYVEETDPKSPEHTLKFKAASYIWGYQLKVPTAEEDAMIETGEGASNTPTTQDMSPLAQQRMWVQQAEDNVIDRLYVAGLIDAPSEFDKTMTQIANNILAYNKIPVDRPFKVRTLLTQPLETLSVGNTILISKGLIDTTAVFTPDGANDPQVGNLYALLAFQVAHIVLGHHIDTKFAFNDRLLFPSEAAFQKLPMYHTDAEDTAAAKKAVDLLSGSPDLEKGEKYFSLYLQQLQAREKALKALTDPQMGDSLFRPDGTFWLSALLTKGPKLNNTDLTQQAAQPLDYFLKTDSWTDQVDQLNSPTDRLISASEKLPFEVHAIFLQLSEYKAPAPPAGTPGAAPADAAPATAPAAPATDATAPGAAAPAADGTAPVAAPATGTANPPLL